MIQLKMSGMFFLGHSVLTYLLAYLVTHNVTKLLACFYCYRNQ